MTRLLPCLLLLSLAGCATPETYDHPAARVVAAVPFLTWIDGDPEDRTTTLVSLPLLTYRTTEDGPGYRRSRACVLPLLGRFDQTDRFVRIDWPRPACPDDEPTTKTKTKKAKKKKKGTMRIEVVTPRRRGGGGMDLIPEGARRRRTRPTRRASKPRATRRRAAKPRAVDRRSPKPTRRRTAKPTPRKRTGITRADPAPPPPAAKLETEFPVGSAMWVGEGRHRRIVLTLDRPAKVLRQKPAQSTDANLLWPLIRFKTERPALLALRVEGGSKTRIFELGKTEDEIRILPLFSFERTARRKQLILWPLLASGYETVGKKSYLRLFYFIRIPLG